MSEQIITKFNIPLRKSRRGNKKTPLLIVFCLIASSIITFVIPCLLGLLINVSAGYALIVYTMQIKDILLWLINGGLIYIAVKGNKGEK